MEAIHAVLEYIEENLDQELSLEEIADRAGYSKFYLNRVFSEEVGCTIHKYIQARRLTESAKKLTETDKPIIEIAMEAGYQSQQAFHYAFKQLYHQSPHVYRTMGAFAPKQLPHTVFAVRAVNGWGCMAA